MVEVSSPFVRQTLPAELVAEEVKNKVPFKSVSRLGEKSVIPGAISFTNCVPAVVPSVRQSSIPWFDPLH